MPRFPVLRFVAHRSIHLARMGTYWGWWRRTYYNVVRTSYVASGMEEMT